MAQPSKPKMGKKTPGVNAKAMASTRKSDKVANPKSPRNLRDIKMTKNRLKMEAGVKATQKKNSQKKVLGGDTY
jgi:hypothetical protein